MFHRLLKALKCCSAPPRPTKRILVHIGTHKTGTSSIQHYLHDHRALLEKLGVGYYEGVLRPDNHVELHLLTERADRGSVYRYQHPDIDTNQLREQTTRKLQQFLGNDTFHTYIFSAEGLSYLRFAEEAQALKSLLGHRHPIEIVLYLRQPLDFLASYTNQLSKMGIPSSPQPDAFNYVETDSWLLDYDGLTSLYQQHFQQICVLNYELELQRCRTVVESFLSLLPVPRTQLPDSAPYWKNKRQAA